MMTVFIVLVVLCRTGAMLRLLGTTVSFTGLSFVKTDVPLWVTLLSDLNVLRRVGVTAATRVIRGCVTWVSGLTLLGRPTFSLRTVQLALVGTCVSARGMF